MARALAPAQAALPPDDPRQCAACGGTEVSPLAEGVYRCSCGFEGGPGLALFAWKLQTERIAEMSAEARDARLAVELAEARAKLGAARTDFDVATRSFREGAAIEPLDRQAQTRKRMFHDMVLQNPGSTERHLTEAIGSIELVRHIRSAGGRMSESYDALGELDALRETGELDDYYAAVSDVLSTLERALDG